MAELRAVFNLDRADVERALSGPDSLPRQQMARLGRRIEANAKQRAPVDTGNLRRSIGHRLTQDSPTRLVLEVFATANYSRFVHDGTRPHLIVPKRKKVLRFQAGGRTVFSAWAHHPGTRGRPFLLNAVQDELGRL